MEELKLCPFCGGKAYTSHNNYTEEEASLHWVECDECCATTEFVEYKSDAIKAWNKRANEKPPSQTP